MIKPAAKKINVDNEILQELVPLNALSRARFEEVAKKIVIEELRAGSYLFRKGDRDSQSVYVLAGRVNLVDGFRKVTAEVEAGTDISRYPIANQQPRPLSARAAEKVVIARVDSGLVDVFLTWDQSSDTEAVEIGADSNEDWMTRMLQNEAFIKIPPAMLQTLLRKMKTFTVSTGDVIIQEGDIGDYFYTINEGRCAVTRKDTATATDQLLAELGDGDSFGEDALVSDTRRNATVTMLTDGRLMRLAKKDFVDLLQKHLVNHVAYDAAAVMVDDGAVWVDVRTPDEYEAGAFEDSVNIPLSDLRSEVTELVFNAKYIICCDTGRRSESAGFLLSHRGFDVYVLEGGIPGLLSAAPVQPPEAGSVIADAADRSQGESTGQRTTAAGGPSAAAVDSAPGKVGPAGGNTTGLEQVLAAERAENEILAETVIAHQRNEVRMTDQLEQLRSELGETSEKLNALHVQAESEKRKQQSQREQNASLEREVAGLTDAHEHEIEILQQQLGELQAQADAARDECQGLSATALETREGQQAEGQQLRAALARADEKVAALEADLAAAIQSETSQSNESGSQLQEQRDLVSQLQQELAGVEQLHKESSEEFEQQQVLDAELQDRLQQQTQITERQEKELVALQQEAIDEARQATDMAADNTTLTEQLEQAQTELNTTRQQLEQTADAAQAQQALETQVDELQQALEQQQKESSEKFEQQQVRGAELQDRLQQQTQITEKQEKELVALQREAIDEARQATDVAADNTTLTEQLEQAQAELDTTRQQLEQAADAAQAQQAQETRVEELQHLLEQQQQEVSGLSENQTGLVSKVESLQQENTQLQSLLDEASHSLSEQVDKFDTLAADRDASGAAWQEQQARLETERTVLQAELQQVNEQLEAEQTRTAGIEKSSCDNGLQINDLQQQISRQDEARESLELEVGLLRPQLDEMRLELEQQSERAQDLEEENKASARKAHDDLTRKNDNEKELQGQLTRLRKKLEQSTSDLKSAHEGAQADVDNIREVLNEERHARVEERAEMAARQRELKEQLAAIGAEHESKLTNQSGALEEVRLAVQAEEQERTEQLHAALGQSESRVIKLQDELQNAHEEITEISRQEKNRRKVEIAVMDEQSQQAITTISVLESQLKQITRDRDESLDEQEVLRSKFNTLRGEVEVARGLMAVSSQGQIEDPEKLREQLNESKKCLQVALRLRANAEAVRDQLLNEKTARQAASGAETGAQSPLHVPALDAGAAVRGHPGPGQPVPQVAGPVRLMIRKKEEAVGPVSKGRLRYRTGVVIGLVVVAAIALMVWLLPGTKDTSRVVEQQQPAVAQQAVAETGITDLVVSEAPASTSAPATPVARPVEAARLPVITPTVPEPQQPALTKRTDSGVEMQPSVAGASTQTAVARPTGPAGDVVEIPFSEMDISAVESPLPAPVAAIRSFRDELNDGSKGPMMVELPAVSFNMGSLGNSLNFDEVPRHPVILAGFSISRHEVTFADYDRFARATGRRLPYDESWGRADRPVINVSWHDARNYVDWLSQQTGRHYRLPTEAEWEFAARAGNDTRHWWSEGTDSLPANCFNCGSEWDGKGTSPTGSFAANDFGLHDTAGNVQEWTEDCFHAGYKGAPDDGSARLNVLCTQRVVRGGAYSSPLDTLRSTRRGQYNQDTRLDNLGFRVVRSN